MPDRRVNRGAPDVLLPQALDRATHPEDDPRRAAATRERTMPLLGCIADDFTGATDLANTLVKGGMTAVQVIGVPDGAACRRRMRSSSR